MVAWLAESQVSELALLTAFGHSVGFDANLHVVEVIPPLLAGSESKNFHERSE